MQCTAKNKRGGPCAAYAMQGTNPPKCFTHNPKMKKQRDRGRRLGGTNRKVHKPSDPLTFTDKQKQSPKTALDLCWQTLHEQRALENSTQRNRVIQQLLGQILKAQEAVDVEARLVALEAIVK